MATSPTIIRSRPGVQRDGTRLDSEAYIDALWTRWRRGLPQKMGGYRNIDDTLSGVARGMGMFNRGGLAYVYAGSGSLLEQAVLNADGDVVSYANRTPSGFATSVDTQWQFDVMYDAVVGNAAQVIAHGTASVSNIDVATARPVYIAPATGTGQLAAISGADVSGGIMAMPPYLTAFGSDGEFLWSDINDPTDFATGDAGQAFIAKQKLVRGLPMRGGPGSSPSGLIWALNGLVRVYYVGGTAIFNSDTLSEETTILSKLSPIEYTGSYFWPGTEHFYTFNGTVREMPNTYSLDWFYDNINPAHAGKTFSFRNKKFGEIWFCFPFQEATECSHAVIYNLRENTWYDTELPNGGRSAAVSPQVYRYPIMAGVQPTVDLTYRLWQHETGVDEVDGATTTPIPAHFETADISLVTLPQGAKDQHLHIESIEPDFTQTGDMTVTITGNKNARSAVEDSEMFTITETAATPSEQIIVFKETRRQLRLKFASNTVGGNFKMGKVVAHVAPNTGTKTG